MRKVIILVIFVILSVFSFSQNLTFGDSELKNYLLYENCVDSDNNGTADTIADFNNDGEIQLSEASSITSLDISTNSYNLTSLSDLTQFQNLEKLVISAPLTSVILSSQSLQTIRVNDCGVEYIDLSNVPNIVDTKFESLALKHLNLKNGSAASTFSLFYSTVDSLICIDSLQTEYNQVLGWGVDSTLISFNCVSNSTNAIYHFTNSELKLYPNPASSHLQLKTGQNIQIISYKIFNHNGQEIDNGKIKSNLININNLNSGLYIIELTTGTGVFTKQFLKN